MRLIVAHGRTLDLYGGTYDVPRYVCVHCTRGEGHDGGPCEPEPDVEYRERLIVAAERHARS